MGFVLVNGCRWLLLEFTPITIPHPSSFVYSKFVLNLSDKNLAPCLQFHSMFW